MADLPWDKIILGALALLGGGLAYYGRIMLWAIAKLIVAKLKDYAASTPSTTDDEVIEELEDEIDKHKPKHKG